MDIIWFILKVVWFRTYFFLYDSDFVQKMIAIVVINVPFLEPYHMET